MSTELLVNVTPRESRAALVENGVLQEVFLERANRRGLISNIYKGKVARVLPGMQAAFIDVGLDRTAFLHANDIVAPPLVEDGIETARPENVRQLISEGDEILVQVLKDPLGTKGARLTTYITLPSRFLVYMPKGRGIGVSARIENEAERARLREAVELFATPGEPGGWIVRTAAEDCAIEALRAPGSSSTRTCRSSSGCSATSSASTSSACWSTRRPRTRGWWISSGPSCRTASVASSRLRPTGRSSTSTASTTRSPGRSTARYRSSRAAT
jgi:hypothetical protein